MKLCIVKPDGTIAEVLMSEQPPFLETVNNELLFFENYPYKLIIRGNEFIKNTELFIGDYSIPLHYNSITDCFETETELIFNGCFDLAYVSVFMDNEEGEEKFLYTDFLHIATTKQTAKQVEQMLDEIEANIPNFLEVCFSHNRKKSGIIKNNIRSIWNTLKILDEIIKIYEENYGYFSNRKKASVESFAAIVDTKSMWTIDQESLRWVVCNPDNLIKTDRNSGIIVNNQNFIPSKIKTYLSQYSYNVYENNVVLGFLRNIIEYLDNQITGFNKEIVEIENIPECIIEQLPNTHELTGRCIYVYYKGVIERFIDKKLLLQEIYYKYEKVLECQAEMIHGIPRFTNTFKRVYHYRLCYECIVKWFEFGDYTFNHLSYLFKLKTLSRIFEYFCLIKLQNALTQCGYIFQEANRIIYDIEDDTEDINNQYIFSGHGYKLTLLYEPYIWVDKINEGINLYSTGYNFSKGNWNDKWMPDFVLKISSDYKDYYYILDAKYSNAQNIKKIYMPELVLKYSTQIASKDKFFSDVIGVGALYPEDKDRMCDFKKNMIGSQKQSLPKYFSLAIVGKSTGDTILKERISELLKVIELIEQDKENAEIQTEKKSTVIKTDIATKNSTKEIVKLDFMEKKSSIKNQSTHKEELADNLKVLITKVNGKKCFYYAKGICMCQKIRCSIVNKPCSLFILKNSKGLLKKEDTCRNFIQYVRREKVNKVKCLVSGFHGCIGVENCKFYKKKNKLKNENTTH